MDDSDLSLCDKTGTAGSYSALGDSWFMGILSWVDVFWIGMGVVVSHSLMPMLLTPNLGTRQAKCEPIDEMYPSGQLVIQGRTM